jgi:hypothetical protein
VHFHHGTLMVLLRLMLLLSVSLLLLPLLKLQLLQRRRLGQQPTCDRIRLASRNKRIEFPLLGPHIPEHRASGWHINPRGLREVVR